MKVINAISRYKSSAEFKRYHDSGPWSDSCDDVSAKLFDEVKKLGAAV